ncbi:hypothetical protein Tsubulata_030100 [Turnera subulata]|uniref:F-box domain-containing protein n=1 Tax=Turnera subulata TaxID=218843 RepID=A0A9Q0EYQ3_9ROSI|nr:hypothetical protein Tsubulata_030100 [Turnera subulata]
MESTIGISNRLSKGEKYSPGNLQPISLPMEVIIEILNRVAVKDVLRFKCVSKELNHLIGDRYFVQKHLDHSPSGIFPVGKQSFTFLYSYHGLILEMHEHSKQFRIRNPAMRQVFYIPKPHKRSRVLRFGFAPTLGFYKWLSVYGSHATGKGYGGIQILVLGTEDKPSWKHVDSTHLESFDKNDLIQVWTVEGVVHIAKINKIQSRDHEVMSFDLDTESFRGHKLVPRSVFPDGSVVSFALGSVALANDELHVLGLNDCQEGKFYGTKTTIPLPFLKENLEMRRKLTVRSISLHGQKNWFGWEDCSAFIYYVREKRKGPEACVGRNGKRTSDAYRSSLVTFKGMRPQPLEES